MSYLFTDDIPAILLAEQNANMGPILRVNMGCRPWMIISDRNMAHEVFNSNGASTSHRPKHTYERLQSAEYGIVFNSPSDRWRKTRAAGKHICLSMSKADISSYTVIQYLSPKHLEASMEIIEIESDYVVNRLISSDELKGVLRHLKHFTMNVVLTLGFGHRIEHPDDSFFDTWLRLIETSMQHADPFYDRRAFLPFIMGVIDWCTGTEKKLTHLMTQVRDPMLQQLIQDGVNSDKECLVKKLNDMKDEDVNEKAIIGACCKFYAMCIIRLLLLTYLIS